MFSGYRHIQSSIVRYINIRMYLFNILIYTNKTRVNRMVLGAGAMTGC